MTIKTTKAEYKLSAVPDPIQVLEGLAQASDAILFESPEGEGRRAEKSLLFPRNGLRIEGRGDTVTITALTEVGKQAIEIIAPKIEELGKVEAADGRLEITIEAPERTGSDSDRIRARNTVDVLTAIHDVYNDASDAESVLRLPGVFAYDLMERFESLPPAASDGAGFPDFVFFVPEVEVELRNDDHSVHIVHHAFGKTNAKEVIAETREALEKSGAKRDSKASDDSAEEPRCEVDLTDGEFASLVSKLKDHIRAGDVFQIVPSRTFSMECADPTAAYRKLREQNPSPYMFYVQSADFTLFGASPEACVKVSGDPRTVEIHPIAGTKPRGRLATGEIDRDLDDRLEAELRLNEKELAEHMMLVDMARNDIARISRAGTRRVKSLCALEKYSRVMHLVSMVEGELSDDIDALHAYLASMNMGTVVGAPKIEAAKLLRKYEKSRRGPYAGAVGYLTSEGEMDSAIVIRSALVRGGKAYVRAGAGIVYDSDPHAEAQETRQKADAVLRAIRSSR